MLSMFSVTFFWNCIISANSQLNVFLKIHSSQISLISVKILDFTFCMKSIRNELFCRLKMAYGPATYYSSHCEGRLISTNTDFASLLVIVTVFRIIYQKVLLIFQFYAVSAVSQLQSRLCSLHVLLLPI